jgi:hypothetical protein
MPLHRSALLHQHSTTRNRAPKQLRDAALSRGAAGADCEGAFDCRRQTSAGNKPCRRLER